MVRELVSLGDGLQSMRHGRGGLRRGRDLRGPRLPRALRLRWRRGGGLLVGFGIARNPHAGGERHHVGPLRLALFERHRVGVDLAPGELVAAGAQHLHGAAVELDAVADLGAVPRRREAPQVCGVEADVCARHRLRVERHVAHVHEAALLVDALDHPGNAAVGARFEHRIADAHDALTRRHRVDRGNGGLDGRNRLDHGAAGESALDGAELVVAGHAVAPHAAEPRLGALPGAHAQHGRRGRGRAGNLCGGGYHGRHHGDGRAVALQAREHGARGVERHRERAAVGERAGEERRGELGEEDVGGVHWASFTGERCADHVAR